MRGILKNDSVDITPYENIQIDLNFQLIQWLNFISK